jgi:hypothetical protein
MSIPPPPMASFYKPEKTSLKEYLLIFLSIFTILGFGVSLYFLIILRPLG